MSPRRNALERRRYLKHAQIVEATSNDLQSDGQAGCGKAAGDRGRRVAGQVERIGELRPTHPVPRVLRPVLRLQPLRWESGNGYGWREEEIPVVEEMMNFGTVGVFDKPHGLIVGQRDVLPRFDARDKSRIHHAPHSVHSMGKPRVFVAPTRWRLQRSHMVDLASLPAEVRALIEAQAATIASQGAELVAHRAMVETLRLQLARLRRMQFGRSSEKLDAEIAQLTLALEDLEAGIERKDPPVEPEPSSGSEAPDRKPARRPLPDHLLRTTIAHAVACTCPHCGGVLRPLGEDVTEVLDYVPASFRVIRHVRPKFSCRSCEAITQAPAPELPIRRGRATAGLLAHVLVAKFADHLPLYRQSEIYAREGVELERSTMADWVGQSATLLRPLVEALGQHVLAGERVHADDTPVPVLAPGAGKTKTGRLWAYLRDERPHGGAAAPAGHTCATSARMAGRRRQR